MEGTKDATISFGGLSSGLDTNSIVPALVDKARAPMRKVEQQQEILQSHQDLLQTVIGMMSSLGNQAHRMDTVAKFMAQRATSTDEGVVLATAGDGAVHGTYHVQVERLATGQKVWSDPLDAADDASLVGSGTLSWQSRGERVSVEADANAELTLAGLADAINRLNKGVHARVLFDGNQYRLQLEGGQTGDEGALQIEEDGLNLGLTREENTVHQASAARFTIDQLPMTRPNNVVHDAIDGVTLVLGEEEASAVVRVSACLASAVNSVSSLAAIDGVIRLLPAITDSTASPTSSIEISFSRYPLAPALIAS